MFASVVVVLPLIYDDHVTSREVLDVVTQLIVWLLLAFVVMFLMAYVRAQRLGLRLAGEQARQQARADPLTGLLNRRAFDEDLSAAIARARAGGQPLSLLVGDLDDFKDFNDRYGHLEGDRVLQAIATSMRSAVRRPDVAYRWGGDEFAVILPQADAAGAGLVAERVRAAVAQETGPDGAGLALAVGVAQLDGSGDPAALVAAADAALLQSKGSGPDRVPRSPG
jgi:diguanylate cyclase (GGDEF)-like protein